MMLSDRFEVEAKCCAYLRDRDRNAEGGDNYYLDGFAS
jgi:hypothetical protein